MARNPTSVLTTTAPRKLEMETWLKASGGKVSARKLNMPTLVGVNPTRVTQAPEANGRAAPGPWGRFNG